jgi:hypothetical protein
MALARRVNAQASRGEYAGMGDAGSIWDPRESHRVAGIG